MSTIVRGIALRPTVSLNKRKYTPELIQKAHARLAERLADPHGMPVTMRTFHPGSKGADADVTSIAGHLTKAELTSDGAIKYEAVLADTPAGDTVAKLATPDTNGQQHLAHVSIRGYAIGPVVKDGDGNETFDDLEIAGLDCTDDPGVRGTSLTTGRSIPPAPEEESAGRELIVESVDSAFVDSTPLAETAESTTEAKPTPVTPGASNYADPGWQADKKARYPVDTKAHALAAWAYFSKPTNSGKYTAAQAKTIKGKIRAALKKFGVTVKESAPFAQLVSDALAAIVEHLTSAVQRGVEEARAAVCLYNGEGSIDVSGWVDDPSQLPALAGKITAAAMAALRTLDPDNDGDIDGVKGAPMECAECECVMPDGAAFCPYCGTAVPTPVPAPAGAVIPEAAASRTQEEGEMPESHETPAAPAATETTETTPAAETAPAAAPALDVAALAEAIKNGFVAGVAALKATESAPTASEGDAAPAAETAPTEPKFLTEEQAQAIWDANETKVRDSVLQEARKEGYSPARRGLVRAAESVEEKPYAEMTPAEREDYASSVFDNLGAQFFPGAFGTTEA